MVSRVRFAILAALCGLVFVDASGAQNPSRSWKTLKTPHFRVHFTPELEQYAQRAGVAAESAYVRLRTHLAPPAGMIDVVIADNVDFANGSATPFPSNRIVINAATPLGDESLGFFDDPLDQVLTHELTHIFHLDRARGIWRIPRFVFGRDPTYMPNAYAPSWLVEGLAVYYESLITGSGRIEGTYHRMLARSAAGARDFPRLSQLSLASPRFPYGVRAYAYGSLFVDHLGKEYGDSSVRAMVESGSAGWIPIWLDWQALNAYGAGFTSLYNRWRAQQEHAEGAFTSMAGWRDLTAHAGYANAPRWQDDSTIVYDGTSGKPTNGAYRLQLRGDVVKRTRVARRTSLSVNVKLPNGDLLYSQLELLNPYDLRSDLYIDRRKGGTTRLTRGARLMNPDVRSDGLIVAMQLLPGSARLALVSADGKSITGLTTAGLDTQWTQPMWSPDGRHVAAIRWSRGGTNEVVVIDTTGQVVQTIVRERAVSSAPSWSPDGRYVYFSSDRTGISNLYRAEFKEGADAVLERLTDSRTGVFEPQVSPNGQSLMAVDYRDAGYRIVMTAIDSLRPAAAERVDRGAPRVEFSSAGSASAVSRYSPWKSLLPRYWIPYFERALDSNAVRIGAETSGRDLIGRHSYSALLYVPTDLTGITGAFSYSYAGLGNPVIDIAASQDRDNLSCVLDASQGNACVGFLRRQIRNASVAATLNRIRTRSSSYVSLGGGIEVRDYWTSPSNLLDRIDSLYQHTLYWPRATLSVGWSHVRVPELAISAEDGATVAATARYRWRVDRPSYPNDGTDRSGNALSIVTQATLYKSIPLPGFGNHVFAVRASGGWLDSRNPDYLEVGGVSGGTVELFPGYTLGEGRRTFPVRGFPAGAMRGMRAYSATAEYRAPLALFGGGLGDLPFFTDRSSLTFFADLGSAWCPALYVSRPAPANALCTQSDYDVGRTTFVGADPLIYKHAFTVGSVGSEVSLSTAIGDWDNPIRYRFGVAHPIYGADVLSGVKSWQAYIAVGASF